MTRSLVSLLACFAVGCFLVGCGTVSGPPSARPVPTAIGRPLAESEVARLGLAFPPAGYRARAVEVGCAHACALLESGAVECWGRNDFGELGDGTLTTRSAPRPVLGLPPVEEIAVGCAHACARTASGQVWCWGGGDLGEVGDGSQAGHRNAPVWVPSLSATSIEASGMSSCARESSGGTVCWGSMAWPGGDFDVAASPRALGVEVADAPHVLASRATRVCALDREAHVSCWGYREQRGTETPPIDPPALVPSLGAVTDLDGNSSFYCASTEDAVSCWGSTFPYLAGGEPGVPVRFELGAAPDLAVADGFVCGSTAGETRCMSFDVEMSLVDRSGTAYALEREPRSIPSLGGLAAIDAGSLAACGIDATGLVQCAVLYAVPRPDAPPS